MGFLDPYAIDGALATAAQQRRENFKSAKGQTGIDGPEDLKVVAVDGSPGVAGIMPGGGSIAVESRREAYNVTNTAKDGNALLDVPAAGSSGATHYVIVSVTDPEFHGQEPATVPQLVSSLSGRTRPYLPLARIDLAAGESFDATSEIVDLRSVAVPRNRRRLIAYALTTDDGSWGIVNTGSDGQSWPNLPFDTWRVDVPTWATRANVIGTWKSVRFGSGPLWGHLWVRLGWNPGQSNYVAHRDTDRGTWDLPDYDAPGRWARGPWSVADNISIPAAMRGTNQPVRLRARRADSAAGAGIRPTLTETSSLSIDIEFLEESI